MEDNIECYSIETKEQDLDSINEKCIVEKSCEITIDIHNTENENKNKSVIEKKIEHERDLSRSTDQFEIAILNNNQLEIKKISIS